MSQLLETVWYHYLQAAEILKYEDELISELMSFKSRWSTDNIRATVGGKPQRLTGVRVWHHGPLTNSPYKGGNRFMPGVSIASMESHAAEMSAKCWIHSLPFGGAKGGIAVDPHKCTPEELMNITYQFVDELDQRELIGPFIDIPGPDVGTNQLIMFWMAQRFEFHHRGEPFTDGVVTGKPVTFEGDYVGGIHGRIQATGYGINVAIDELRKPEYKLFQLPEHPTIAMQGFGNVGQYAALYAYEKGQKILAVCDRFGGIFNGDGLDIPKLMEYTHVQKRRSVSGFPDTEAITFEEMIELPCDILMPNALENALTEKNANKVKARLIVEGANGPTTPEADKILKDKGIIIIPDIYANSMGVTVSYFEWGKNTNKTDSRIPRQNKKAAVLKAGEKMMRKAGAEIAHRVETYHISLRLAAFMLALEKAELLRARRIPAYADKMFG